MPQLSARQAAVQALLPIVSRIQIVVKSIDPDVLGGFLSEAAAVLEPTIKDDTQVNIKSEWKVRDVARICQYWIMTFGLRGSAMFRPKFTPPNSDSESLGGAP